MISCTCTSSDLFNFGCKCGYLVVQSTTEASFDDMEEAFMEALANFGDPWCVTGAELDRLGEMNGVPRDIFDSLWEPDDHYRQRILDTLRSLK